MISTLSIAFVHNHHAQWVICSNAEPSFSSTVRKYSGTSFVTLFNWTSTSVQKRRFRFVLISSNSWGTIALNVLKNSHSAYMLHHLLTNCTCMAVSLCTANTATSYLGMAVGIKPLAIRTELWLGLLPNTNCPYTSHVTLSLMARARSFTLFSRFVSFSIYAFMYMGERIRFLKVHR